MIGREALKLRAAPQTKGPVGARLDIMRSIYRKREVCLGA